MVRSTWLLPLLAAACILVLAPTAQATIWYYDDHNNDGDCSDPDEQAHIHYIATPGPNIYLGCVAPPGRGG